MFVSKTDIHSQNERLSYQRSAIIDLKLLGYVALLSILWSKAVSSQNSMSRFQDKLLASINLDGFSMPGHMQIIDVVLCNVLFAY